MNEIDPLDNRKCIILVSYHHNNTEKIAQAMSEVLNAIIINPKDFLRNKYQNSKILGLGSGIYGETHHKTLLDFVDKLTSVENEKVFIFSTAALTNTSKMKNDHSVLRKKLELKGYNIVDEFQCKGFNTNSFLKFFGGMNKGRPNKQDLNNAKNFATNYQRIDSKK